MRSEICDKPVISVAKHGSCGIKILVFSLLVFVLISPILKKITPWLVMLQTDLQTMYVMVVILTAISGHTMMGYRLPVITHAFRLASTVEFLRQTHIIIATLPDAVGEFDLEFGEYKPTGFQSVIE